MLFVRSFVSRQCWPRSGQNGTTARPTAYDHARPTTHDRARPRTHDRARQRTHDRPRTTDHGCHICLRKRYPPHPGGFRGLNCLARLALARERTPSCINVYLAIDSGGNVSDLVLARNCCLARMLPEEAEVGVGMNISAREGKKC